jgi:hypothetical protein
VYVVEEGTTRRTTSANDTQLYPNRVDDQESDSP